MYLNLTPCCLPSRNRKNIISQLDEGFLYVLYGEYQCHVSRVCIGTYSHTIHTYTPTYLHIYIHAYIHILGPTYIHTYIHTYYCTLLWLTCIIFFKIRFMFYHSVTNFETNSHTGYWWGTSTISQSTIREACVILAISFLTRVRLIHSTEFTMTMKIQNID